ncbi:2OG-Fe(II) oxygenase [Cognatiluteimonas telluris]|uniref:2OG-Fe(II) oxygenase n=1 Tax=Cognatiluteimonas telluris TaxID=1104775 RepID=UPI001FAFBDFD|nr:2OG-Fe(II) oxygenase [Lysobacter telluris]
MQSPAFLEFVGRLTNIPDLLYDRDYCGGGTHENRHGQALDNHIDFNLHPGTGGASAAEPDRVPDAGVASWLGRRAGAASRPPDPDTDEVVEVVPAFNRCVIVETTEHSWHGFPRITLPADRKDLSRRSIALYFHTRERPAEQTALKHSTVYVDRALPPHLQPGRVLTERDVADLRELLATRDGHNRRLYCDIATLQSRLDGGFAGQVFNAIRRMLGRLRER